MNRVKEKAEGINKLIESGSAIVGKSAGAALGAAFAGPWGAISGAAAGATCGILVEKGFASIGKEFAARVLGPREEQRIGATLIYALNKIQKRSAAGDQLRTDEFFVRPQPSNPACVEIPFIERPPFEETVEGFLLAVQKEHKENKLPFIGNLLANICFDSSIDRSQINLLIKISEAISFRQMCILSIFSEPYRSKIKGRFFRSRKFPYEDIKLNSLFQEIFDLGSQGLLWNRNSLEPVTNAGYIMNPELVDVVGAGSDLYRLMELDKIVEAYLDPISLKLYPEESSKYPPIKTHRKL